MNKTLITSNFHKGTSTDICGALVAFDLQGKCLGAIRRGGVKLEKPDDDLTEEELGWAAARPREFSLSSRWDNPAKVDDQAPPKNADELSETGALLALGQTREVSVDDAVEVAGKAVVEEPDAAEVARRVADSPSSPSPLSLEEGGAVDELPEDATTKKAVRKAK